MHRVTATSVAISGPLSDSNWSETVPQSHDVYRFTRTLKLVGRKTSVRIADAHCSRYTFRPGHRQETRL